MGGFFEGAFARDFLLCMVVEMMLNCDNSSIVVGRFFSCSCSAAVTASASM